MVREYIETRFLRTPGGGSVRLPAIHAFANDLNVSVSTVRSVFRSLAKEGKIVSTPGRGTYVCRDAIATETKQQRCIGINLSTLSLSPTEWWSSFVFHGAASEALRHYAMITALGATGRETLDEEEIRASIGRMDGVVLLPGGGGELRLRELCLEQGKPVVMASPGGFCTTANFVTADSFAFCFNLARAWRAAGRRRVAVLMGDVASEGVGEAQTLSGFQLAFAHEPGAVVLPVLVEGGSVEEGGYRTMLRELKAGGPPPDAVYCMGDYTAEGALRALRERGLNVPEAVSLAAGTGLEGTRIRTPELVTRLQPMRKIGEAAVRMLLWRLDNGNASAPGIYLPSRLDHGTTMRPEEITLFHQFASTPHPLASIEAG